MFVFVWRGVRRGSKMTSAQFSDTRSRYPRARQRVTQRQDKQRRNLHRPAPKVCVKRCDVCFPKSERTERIRQHRRRLLNKGRVLRMSFAGTCVSVVQGTVPVTASTRLAHPRVQRAQNHQPWPQCRGAGQGDAKLNQGQTRVMSCVPAYRPQEGRGTRVAEIVSVL